MSNHTQGKIGIQSSTGPCVIGSATRMICECYDDGEPQNDEDLANAHRIVATWNACDGIPTADLEQKVVSGFMADLKRQRDELRRALTDLHDQVESLESYTLTRDVEHYKAQACWDDAVDNARALLAKVPA